VSDLPDGWNWVEIDDLATSLANGKSVPDGGDDGYRVLRLTAIRSGTVDITVSKNGAWTSGEAHQFRIREGDFLVARGNGSKHLVGRGGIVKKDADVAYPDTMIRIRFDEARVRPIFAALTWDAPSIRTQIEMAARTTAGIYKISQKDLRKIRIALPPLAEQDRLVAVIEEQFSRLDVGVITLRAVRRNLARLKATALAKASDGVGSWVALGEIAEVVGGVTKDAKRQSDPSFAEVPYLRVANVQRGYLDLREITRIRVPPATVKKLRLEPGDILFNEGGDRDKLGRGWVWNGGIQDCIHQNHVFRARLLSDDFDPKFISIHGNTYGRVWFDKMGKQTVNLASISLTTLKSFPIPVLPLEEQRKVVDEAERWISITDSLGESVNAALRKADSLRSSILSVAFAGDLLDVDRT
jgi:type I restriction enzyme, S subunit